MNLHYQTIGKFNNPSLLFLHGFLGSGSNWLETCESLSDHYFCILPDLPGHGKTDFKLQRDQYKFDAVSQKIIDLLNKLKIDQTALVGYSMGGRVGLFSALTYPHRFTALVLEGANPGLQHFSERQQRKQWEENWISEIRQVGLKEFIDRWYEMPIFRSLHGNPDQFKKLKQQRIKNHPNGLIQSMRGLGLSQQPDLWQRLPDLKLPILLIAGDLDTKYKEINQKIAKQINDVCVEIIPGAGHNAHFEQPGSFGKILRSFLNGIIL